MEADSVHSQIERQVRSRNFNVPADYCDPIKKARMKTTPYDVKYVDHTFFKNYDASLKAIKSIRPGKKVGDPCVVGRVALQYKPDELNFKLRFTDEWKPLPIRTFIS